MFLSDSLPSEIRFRQAYAYSLYLSVMGRVSPVPKPHFSYIPLPIYRGILPCCFSSFFTRSMAFTHIPKVQLSFALFSETFFNDTAEFTLCYGLHDCSHLFQGYFIHSLSTLHYCNAPSLTTRLTGDYRDRTYTGKCGPALLDTR